MAGTESSLPHKKNRRKKSDASEMMEGVEASATLALLYHNNRIGWLLSNQSFSATPSQYISKVLASQPRA